MMRPLLATLLLAGCPFPTGDTGKTGNTGAPCVWTATSTLPGVTLSGGDATCTWRITDADAGVDVPWTVTVDSAVDVTIATANCFDVGESGLRFLAQVTDGAGGRWCPDCDVGLCPMDKSVYTTVPGAWTSTFTWRPRAWDGPSDYGAEPGDLFAPGAYTIRVAAEGTLAADGTPWQLLLEAPLTLE